MAFRLGKHTGIQVLLSGEESQRSERILAYFGYLNEARQKNIDKLNQTRTELASEKKALEAAQNQQKRFSSLSSKLNNSLNLPAFSDKNTVIVGKRSGERPATAL